MPLNADFDARNLELYKYPRTQHLQGSRLQPGDEDMESVPFSALVGRHLVIEEKMDGANAAISFSQSGELLLQSRGHYLTGGNRERHFALFKQWAYAVGHLLRPVLQERYVLYGEWLFAKHTIFYDQLPHYFLEFDMLDRVTMSFLSTERRHELLANLPIVSVKVLAAGTMNQQERMTRMVGSSYFISPNHRQRLRELSEAQGLSASTRAGRERSQWSDGGTLYQSRGRWRGQRSLQVCAHQLSHLGHPIRITLAGTTDCAQPTG